MTLLWLLLYLLVLGTLLRRVGPTLVERLLNRPGMSVAKLRERTSSMSTAAAIATVVAEVAWALLNNRFVGLPGERFALVASIIGAAGGTVFGIAFAIERSIPEERR